MSKRKDWQEEVWRIKKEIAKETKDMSTDEYWAYIKENAKEFLKSIGKLKMPTK